MMHTQIKENRLRGSSAYPIVLYEMPNAETVLSAPMHWQDDVEVLSITQGSVALTLEGCQQLLHAGDIVWINPGQIHSFRAHTPDARCEIFIFPVQHLLFSEEDHDQQRWLRPLAEGKLHFPVQIPPDNPAYPLQEQLIALQKQRPVAYEMLTKALLLQMISHLVKSGALLRHQSSKNEDVCKEILRYIHKNYARKLTVEEVAHAVGISPTYFSAFFVRHFFCHFTDYLRAYRIEQACAMLSGTDMSVTGIALATGFNSGSHLIQHFRKAKGLTPLAYRHAGR